MLAKPEESQIFKNKEKTSKTMKKWANKEDDGKIWQPPSLLTIDAKEISVV